MADDDRQLIARIACGEQDALRSLYERYAERLARFAMSRLGDPEEARDAAQETLIAAWESAGSFRGASSVNTWLVGICRNRVGERLRRRSVPVEPLQLAETLSVDAGESAVEFWDSFSKLDDADRELLLLVFYEGLSQAEVAEMLEIPVGTVKSRTHYARRRLQALLEEAV